MACSVELTISNLVFLGVVVLALKKLFSLFLQYRTDQMLEKYDSSPKDKVLLHTVWRGKIIPSPSPFALKLETYLRMAKIPYELETKNPRGAKGKLPWITYNGTHVADSHLCIEFLNKKFSTNLNQKTDDEQLATARACRVMLEEHFFWGLAQYRVIENSSAFTQVIKLPTFLKYAMPLLKYRAQNKLNAIGIGLHTPSEIYQMTGDDLRTVSKILGNKKFFGGDEEPCEEDCAIFGMVAQAVWGLPGSSFERLVHGELSNLNEYCQRMRQLYWPDWEEILDRSS